MSISFVSPVLTVGHRKRGQGIRSNINTVVDGQDLHIEDQLMPKSPENIRYDVKSLHCNLIYSINNIANMI